MNAYDFDGTIYDGDSSFDYYRHCLVRYAGVRRHALGLIGPGIRFALGKMEKTAWKQAFFGFLRHVPDVELDVLLFWDRNEHRMKPFYLAQRQPDDIILSASPEFLIRPMLSRMGVRAVIASRVDARTGQFDGPNCWGEEKLLRLRAAYPEAKIDAFYSDSPSDEPLARIAARAYRVSGGRIREWRR